MEPMKRMTRPAHGVTASGVTVIELTIMTDVSPSLVQLLNPTPTVVMVRGHGLQCGYLGLYVVSTYNTEHEQENRTVDAASDPSPGHDSPPRPPLDGDVAQRVRGQLCRLVRYQRLG